MSHQTPSQDIIFPLFILSPSFAQGKQWKTVGNYIPQTQSISLFRDPIFPGGVTIPIVGPVKPSYKIAAFFPTDGSFGPMADLAKEWVSKTKNITYTYLFLLGFFSD